MKKPAPQIDFQEFVFDFMEEASWEEEHGDKEYVSLTALEDMQTALPKAAKLLGDMDDEVDNWCTWTIEDFYYLMPWADTDFEWALFRISWDDNWGRYNWESCARVSGVQDARAAGRAMLKALFGRWGIDLNDSDNKPYRRLIRSC